MNAGPEWEAGSPPEPPRPPGPQPMRLGMVLDVGVRILRRHWAVLLILALAFAGPGALLTAATGMRFNEVALDLFPSISEGYIDDGVVLTESEFSRLVEALGVYLLATVVAGLLASIGALTFSAVVAADYHARRVELGSVLRLGLRRAPTALVFILITSLVIVGIVLGGVVAIVAAMAVLPSGAGGGPGAFLALVVVVALVAAVLYLTMRWAPAFPAMVNEDIGWRESLARSWHLSGDNVWRIVFVIAFATITTMFVAAVISQVLAIVVVGALAPAIGLDETVGESVALAFGSMLLAPLTPVLTAVLYFDLRARRDVPSASAPPVESPADPYR